MKGIAAASGAFHFQDRELNMTPQEVTNDVLARMPQQNRLPELTDHENAEMYKKASRAMRDYRRSKSVEGSSEQT